MIRCDRSAVLGLEISASAGTAAPRGGLELSYLMQQAALSASAPASVAGDFTGFLTDGHTVTGRFGQWTGAATGATDGPALAGLVIPAQPGWPRLMLQDPVRGQSATPGEVLDTAGGALSALRIWIDDPDGQTALQVAADFSRAGRVEAQATLINLAGDGPEDRLLRLKLALTVGPAAATDITAAPRQDRIRIFRKT